SWSTSLVASLARAGSGRRVARRPPRSRGASILAGARSLCRLAAQIIARGIRRLQSHGRPRMHFRGRVDHIRLLDAPIARRTLASMTHSPRKLGATGPSVFPLALGCMGMSGMYGAADEDESIATIHAALERGITLIDTGDFYGQGHNEMLIGRALRGRRDRALLSVKFGALRGPDGAWGGFDARPAAVKNFLTCSLRRLGVDFIDVYRPARLDPAVPIEDTIGAIADMVKQGYVRHIGLSEVGADTIRRAHAVHAIVDLQIEYSLVSRGPEAGIFPALAEIGAAAT